jgi:hypothetical protein
LQKSSLKKLPLTGYFLPFVLKINKKKRPKMQYKSIQYWLSLDFRLKSTTSYFKINGIMCCIVLKCLYLCVIRMKDHIVPDDQILIPD